MANNITVKDASSNNIQIHTIEDSTSAHYNMSIPITVSGVPIFTTAAPGVVSLADSIVGVSISPTQGNIPVSVNGLLAATQSGTWTVQPGNTPNTTPWLVSVNGIPKVSVADSTLAVTQSGTWNTNASVVGRVSVFVDATPFNVSIGPGQGSIPVSIAGGSLAIADNAPVSVRGGRVSIADGALAVTQSGTWNVGALTSVNSIVKVSVEGSLTVSGSTLVVSVGGATSTQAVPVAFRDTGGDARQPLLTTGGALIVHVCNAQAAPGSDVSVSPTQGSIPVSIAGGSLAIADNAPVSVRGGVLGAVSLGGGSANIGTVSISPTQGSVPVSIAGGSLAIADNAPVSVRGGRVSIADGTLAVTQSGTWTIQPGNTANTTPWLVSVNGIPKVSIADSTLAAAQSGTWNVGINAGTNLVGAVSVRQIVSVQPEGGNFAVSIAGTPTVTINDNAPVSVRGGRVSIADGTLAVTQSGTWTVQPGNTPNTTPWLVSVNGIPKVSVADSTLAVTQSGTWNINASVVGRVSVFVDQVPFNVSINNTLPVPVSIVGGRVSVQGISQVSVAGAVTVSPLTNTGAAVPNGAFFVGGTDGTNLRGMAVDTAGATIVTGNVTNAESSFTRPADTTAYASGDLVANNTTAGSVTPLAFPVSKFSTGGGTIFIRRARIVKSTGSLTNAQFRLHLYGTSNGVTNQGVSVAAGDNGAYTATKVSTYLGFISVTMAVSHSDGAVGWGMPNEGMEMNVRLPANQFNLQGLLEARAAYTPGNAERFNVTLEAYQE